MNAAKAAKDFIEKRPVIKECLAKGLLNYSELARKIIEQNALKKSDFDAVLVAVRRLAEKAKPSRDSEKAIMQLLAKSKLEIKTRVCSVVLDQSIPFSFLTKLIGEINEKNEPCHLIQGNRAFTLITSEEFLPVIEKSFAGKIISKIKSLVQIVFVTAPAIESTPGVIAYLYGLFAEHGINIVETMSSWTETLIVVEEKDLAKAMEILKF